MSRERRRGWCNEHWQLCLTAAVAAFVGGAAFTIVGELAFSSVHLALRWLIPGVVVVGILVAGAARPQGPGLIDAVLVLGVPLFFGMFAGSNEVGAANRARQKRTMATLRVLGTAIEQYQVDHERLPAIDDGPALRLADALVPTYLVQVIATDGWGQPIYWQRGSSTRYSLFSFGRDRRAHDGIVQRGTTTDFDSDIYYSDGEFVIWPEGTHH